MPINTVDEWLVAAANNTDIGGIDIDEGCAAANINNAIRELMAQVATLRPDWLRTANIGTDVQAFNSVLADLTGVTNVSLQRVLGQDMPIIADASAQGTIVPGFYAYRTGSGSTGGPSAVGTGTLIHSRRTSGGGESQILITDAPALEAGRIFTRTRDTGAWVDWVELASITTVNSLITTAVDAAVAGLDVKNITDSRVWQNVTGSRSLNVLQTNNAGWDIEILVVGDNFGSVGVGPDAGSLITTGDVDTDGSDSDNVINLTIPNNHVYQVNGVSLRSWLERR